MKKNLLFIFCFFTFGLTAQIPSYVPTNGLVGWWPFNGNANDESGNGNHGTVNGASLTIDRFGVVNKAYNFDGVSNYIITPISTIPSNNFSFSAWFWVDNQGLSGGNHRTIIGSRTSGASFVGIGFNSEPAFFFDMPTTPFRCSKNINLPTDQIWHNVIATYNGDTAKLFLDGVLLNKIHIPNPNSMNLISKRILFGFDEVYAGDNRFWRGKIDDIIIWNRAINSQEIYNLYLNSFPCTTPIATITPQSNLNFCHGNSVMLNATTGTNFTYEWYNNGTLISGAATNSYAATTAGNYTVKVIDGSCNATSSATTLTLIDTVTWTGIVDNDWHKPCNWSPEVVPECCNSVKIPFTPNSPVVSGVGKAKNVTLYSSSGATLTVNNGANLQIETCPVNKTENSCPTLPIISTTAISSITQTTAVSGGNITYSGASSITARGVCWSTTTAPTIANSKTTDGSGIGTYTSNLTVLTAGTTYYVRAYATNASGTSYGNEVSFIAVNPQPAYSLGSVYCNGTPTLVVDVTNPTTGKTWMDRNLGASQAATSSTDPLAYGDLYQWGRGSDGHQCRNSSTTSVLSSTDQPGHGNFILAPNSPLDWRSPQNTNLWQGTNGVNNPCPSGYRIPTKIELINETNNWNSNNYIDDAFISILKFSIGGFKDNSGNLNSGAGHYWSSDLSQSNFVGQSKHLTIYNSLKVISDNERSSGMSVRCIKN